MIMVAGRRVDGTPEQARDFVRRHPDPITISICLPELATKGQLSSIGYPITIGIIITGISDTITIGICLIRICNLLRDSCLAPSDYPITIGIGITGIPYPITISICLIRV